MCFPVPSRRWFVWLLILVLSAGLGVPAFAGRGDNGPHTAAVAAAHGTCLHVATDVGPHSEADDDGSDAQAAADCALAHLGQAVLDRLASYSVRMIHHAYPPANAGGSAGQVPSLEGDPPRLARIV